MAEKAFSKEIDKVFKNVEKYIETSSLDEVTVFNDANVKFSKVYEKMTNMNDYKLQYDFINSACNIVENLYDDETFKSNKKTLAINMLKACLASKNLAYTPDELKILDGNIECLHSRGDFIKITKQHKRMSKAKNFFSTLFSPN